MAAVGLGNLRDVPQEKYLPRRDCVRPGVPDAVDMHIGRQEGKEIQTLVPLRNYVKSTVLTINL